MVLQPHSRRPSMAGSEASAANHHPGDSSGSQNRCEPSPNILGYENQAGK